MRHSWHVLARATILTVGFELALGTQSAARSMWLLDPFTVAGCVYATAGLVVWARHSGNLMGALMIGGGLSWLAAALTDAEMPVLAAMGTVLASVPLAVAVHLLLAFPSGRLRSSAPRRLVTAGYATALLSQVPQYLFAPMVSTTSMLAIANRPELAAWGAWIQRCVGSVGMLAIGVILADRVRQTSASQRRLLLPLYAYGITAVLFVLLAPHKGAPHAGTSSAVAAGLQVAVLAGVPVAFAVAILWGGFGADLLTGREALRQSRIRLVQATDRERRQIAQNLHDVLQTRLVLLALEAQRAASLPATPPAVADAIVGLRMRIDSVAAEVRELVHAVMPASLIERGLCAAAEDLTDRMPVPTKLDLDVPGTIPDVVSGTAYFVIAEALANAVKHARAASLEVRLRSTDQRLIVEVRDDGIGGAVRGRGLGLRGLADRVEALDGTLTIESPPGGGTRLVAELPCA